MKTLKRERLDDAETRAAFTRLARLPK